jgi:hypothetical protein
MRLRDKAIPVTATGMGEGMARVFVRENVAYYGAGSCRWRVSPAPPACLSGGAALVKEAGIGRNPAERI